MAKHQNLSSPYSVHPFAYTSNADPASDASIDMAPYKGWINTGNSNLLKVRNAANGAWEDVSVAGAATAPAFGSNSASVTTYNDNAGTLAAANAHHHIGVRSIAHTSNTFSGPVILTASGQVGITSPTAGTLNINVAGSAGSGGGASVTSSENRLTGDVSIASGDTYYDGPSLTLAAGTYDLIGRVTIKNTSGSGTQITAKLWNGTTAYDSTQEWGETNNGIYTLTLVKASLVLSGSTTVKVSVAQSAAGGTILATVPNNATGLTNMASVLTAAKIA